MMTPEEYRLNWFGQDIPPGFDVSLIPGYQPGMEIQKPAALAELPEDLRAAYFLYSSLYQSVENGQRTPAAAELSFAQIEPIFLLYGVPYSNPWRGSSIGTEYQEPVKEKEIETITQAAGQQFAEVFQNLGIEEKYPEVISTAQEIMQQTGATVQDAIGSALVEIVQDVPKQIIQNQQTLQPESESDRIIDIDLPVSESSIIPELSSKTMWLILLGFGLLAVFASKSSNKKASVYA